jgi:hypothetical protein
MIGFPSSDSRFGTVSAVAILLCAGLQSAPALAEVKAGVDVSLAGRVASNPFNDQSSGAAVVALSPSVEPWLSYEDPDTTVSARGNVLTDRYTQDYGSTTSALAGLDIRQAMSQRVTLTGGIGYSNSNNTSSAFLLQQGSTTDTAVPPGTPLPDISTLGLRIRTQTLNGHVGGGFVLSEYDSLSINLTAGLARSDASSTSDFNNAGGGLSYSRQLSGRTSALISVQFNKVDYLRTVQNDSTIISPLVGFQHQLGERLHLQASIGVSIARTKFAEGITTNSTALAGNAQLCGQIYRGGICLRASRTAQPGALGGISVATEASLNVDRVVSRSSSVSGGIRYSRNQQQSAVADTQGFAQDLLGVQISYSRTFSPRFSFFATPSYTKPFDSVASRSANIEVRAGLKYRFGAIQ